MAATLSSKFVVIPVKLKELQFWALIIKLLPFITAPANKVPNKSFN